MVDQGLAKVGLVVCVRAGQCGSRAAGGEGRSGIVCPDNFDPVLLVNEHLAAKTGSKLSAEQQEKVNQRVEKMVEQGLARVRVNQMAWIEGWRGYRNQRTNQIQLDQGLAKVGVRAGRWRR